MHNTNTYANHIYVVNEYALITASISNKNNLCIHL